MGDGVSPTGVQQTIYHYTEQSCPQAPVVMPTGSKMADENKPEQSRSDFDPVLAEISKAIAETFDTFDHESNKTVDKR